MAVAVVAGGAITAAAVAPALGSANGSADRGTFTLFEHDTSDQSDNIGDPSTGIGNLFIFGGDVLDHQGGTQLGRMGGS